MFYFYINITLIHYCISYFNKRFLLLADMCFTTVSSVLFASLLTLVATDHVGPGDIPLVDEAGGVMIPMDIHENRIAPKQGVPQGVLPPGPVKQGRPHNIVIILNRNGIVSKKTKIPIGPNGDGEFRRVIPRTIRDPNVGGVAITRMNGPRINIIPVRNRPPGINSKFPATGISPPAHALLRGNRQAISGIIGDNASIGRIRPTPGGPATTFIRDPNFLSALGKRGIISSNIAQNPPISGRPDPVFNNGVFRGNPAGVLGTQGAIPNASGVPNQNMVFFRGIQNPNTVSALGKRGIISRAGINNGVANFNTNAFANRLNGAHFPNTGNVGKFHNPALRFSNTVTNQRRQMFPYMYYNGYPYYLYNNHSIGMRNGFTSGSWINVLPIGFNRLKG